MERKTFECEGIVYLTEAIAASDRNAAAKEFRSKHPGVRVESVDDEMILSWCELCGGPLFEGDQCSTDTEGVTWHEPDCPAEPAPPEEADRG